MPHVIVKLYPGRTEEQKQELTAAIVKDVMAIAKCPETAVSVAFEEFAPADWPEKVYKHGHPGKARDPLSETGVQESFRVKGLFAFSRMTDYNYPHENPQLLAD